MTPTHGRPRLPRGLTPAVLAFAALAGLSAAGLADDKPAITGDLKKIQGKWTAPAQEGGKVTYLFDGKTLAVVAPSRSYVMTVTLDPDAKPEKTIDFKITEGPDDSKGQTSKGIYKLEGDDAFTFCFSPTGDRPAKYEQEGYEKIVTKLTRAKD